MKKVKGMTFPGTHVYKNKSTKEGSHLFNSSLYTFVLWTYNYPHLVATCRNNTGIGFVTVMESE